MESNYTFKTADLSDVDRLFELEQICFGPEAFSKSQFNYLITKAKAHVALLLESQKLAGYLILLFRKNSLQLRIYSVAVSPLKQEKGLGKQLLNYAEQVAIANDKKNLTLEVNEHNQPAISLYLKSEFKITGTKSGYYHDGSTALLMKKKLTR